MRLRTHPTLPHAPLDPCVHNIFIVRCEQFFWQLGSKQKTANPGLLGVTFYLLDLIFLTSPGGCNYPEFIDGQTERLNSPCMTHGWEVAKTGLTAGGFIPPWVMVPLGGSGGQGWAPGSLSSLRPPLYTHTTSRSRSSTCSHTGLSVRMDALCATCYFALTGASYSPEAPVLTVLWVTSPFCLSRRWCSERIKPLTTAIELGLQHRTLYLCPLALASQGRGAQKRGIHTLMAGTVPSVSPLGGCGLNLESVGPSPHSEMLAASQPFNFCVKWVPR